MFPNVSALNPLNVFDLRKATPANNNTSNVNPFMKQAVAATQYTPTHPRHVDSDGVDGASPLARKLDILS
jgi:hypothetical protein